MFAKTIIDSDAFLDMPATSQLLYFHLSMRADDEGFINNPKSIMRNCRCNEDDMNVLILKKFIIPFESGVVVIKHWKIHNYIAKDRFKETKYKEERETLSLDENNSYTKCIQPVYKVDTQVRLGKERIDKVSEVEGSVEDADNCDRKKLQKIGGMGKDVVFLSDEQFDSLIDILGLDAFDRYVTRLADFITQKNAHVNNHYETILKWYKEDSGIKEDK